MPIPINPARQRTNAPGQLSLVRPQAQPNALGELGDALGGAARGIQQRQQEQQSFARQKQEEKAAVFANEALMSSRAKWVEELPKRQAAASESGEGFALGVLQAFDDD